MGLAETLLAGGKVNPYPEEVSICENKVLSSPDDIEVSVLEKER